MAVQTFVTQDCGGFTCVSWDPTVANRAATGMGNATVFSGSTAQVSSGTSGAQPNKDRGRHIGEARTS